jgi:mannosyltransferase
MASAHNNDLMLVNKMTSTRLTVAMVAARSLSNIPLVIALIMAVGLALRVFHLGTASLWNDELFTRFYPELGINYMWTKGFALETTPPTYYTLMEGWSHLFGTSAIALRLPSVICSTLAIPLVYVLGRDLCGFTRGLLAALIFAFAPMEIYFAQEARAYALWLLPTGLAMVGVVRFLRAPTSRGAAIWYSTAIVLSIYVHNVSAFLAAATGIAVLMDLLTDKSLSDGLRRKAILRWIWINAGIALLCLPQLFAMISETKTDQLHWMTQMSVWDIRNAVSMFVAGPATTPLKISSALTILLGIAMVAVIWRLPMARRTVTVLIAIPVLYFALMIVAGLHGPFLVPRLLCWMWIPLSVLLAAGLLHRSPARPFLVAATGAVFAVGLGFQLLQNATAKEPWGLFLPRLQPWLAEADLVVTGPWTEPMALANDGVPMTKVRHWDEDFPPTSESVSIPELLGVHEISRDALSAAIRSGKRVLLIQRNVEFPYRQELAGLPEPSHEILQECWGGPCLDAVFWNAPSHAK